MTQSKVHPFFALKGKPSVMGILNVTRSSFSDGGKFINPDKAIEHGIEMVKNGADIIDIGGESTKPGSQPIDINEEIFRVVPVIEGLKGKAPIISIDSRNGRTMEAALKVGANIINDISALTHDPYSVGVAAEAKVPIVLMHMQNTPVDMQEKPKYNNVIKEIFDFLKSRISYCETQGIDAEMLIADPGIGFGKTLEHNLIILRNIKEFQKLGVPVLLGASRKSFIGKITGENNPDQRLAGSLASVLWGMSQGVNIFRVHDVKETVRAIQVYQSVSESALSEISTSTISSAA